MWPFNVGCVMANCIDHKFCRECLIEFNNLGEPALQANIIKGRPLVADKCLNALRLSVSWGVLLPYRVFPSLSLIRCFALRILSYIRENGKRCIVIPYTYIYNHDKYLWPYEILLRTCTTYCSLKFTLTFTSMSSVSWSSTTKMNREDNFSNDSEDDLNEDTSIQTRSNAASY